MSKQMYSWTQMHTSKKHKHTIKFRLTHESTKKPSDIILFIVDNHEVYASKQNYIEDDTCLKHCLDTQRYNHNSGLFKF